MAQGGFEPAPPANLGYSIGEIWSKMLVNRAQ